jgi:hypothetical protein
MQNSSKSHHAASHITKDEIPKVILNATLTSTLRTEGTQNRYLFMLSASDSRRFSSWATVLDSGLLKAEGKHPVGEVNLPVIQNVLFIVAFY